MTLAGWARTLDHAEACLSTGVVVFPVGGITGVGDGALISRLALLVHATGKLAVQNA